jgi:hypothetical protein
MNERMAVLVPFESGGLMAQTRLREPQFGRILFAPQSRQDLRAGLGPVIENG